MMKEDEEDGDEEEVEGGGGGTAKLKRLDTPPRCSDLIVLGLPYKTTQEQFKSYFEQFGKVAAAEVCVMRSSCKGWRHECRMFVGVRQRHRR